MQVLFAASQHPSKNLFSKEIVNLIIGIEPMGAVLGADDADLSAEALDQTKARETTVTQATCIPSGPAWDWYVVFMLNP